MDERKSGRAAALRQKIETDLERLYAMCRQQLSAAGFKADAKEFSLLDESVIELSRPIAKLRLVSDRLAMRGA